MPCHFSSSVAEGGEVRLGVRQVDAHGSCRTSRPSLSLRKHVARRELGFEARLEEKISSLRDASRGPWRSRPREPSRTNYRRESRRALSQLSSRNPWPSRFPWGLTGTGHYEPAKGAFSVDSALRVKDAPVLSVKGSGPIRGAAKAGRNVEDTSARPSFRKHSSPITAAGFERNRQPRRAEARHLRGALAAPDAGKARSQVTGAAAPRRETADCRR